MATVQEKEEVAEVQNYGTEQVIVFKQGGEEYGLMIDQIKEVVLTPHITQMPQTPDYIKGVANIRGNIIAIIDLEEKFELNTKDQSADAHGYTLVVESDEYKVGILVNEVPNTLSVSEKDVEEAINVTNSSDTDQEYIKGIIKLDNRLIILIDIFRVLNGKDKELIASKQD